MTELWSPVEGFPEYAVSSHGRVLNVKTHRELKYRLDSYNNARVALHSGGLVKQFMVHQLVAKAFMTGWKPNIRIKHHDDDNANNHVENLRFYGDRNIGQFRNRQPDIMYRKVRIVETGDLFWTVILCAEHLNTHPSSIYRVLRGDRMTHLGYTFELVEE